MKKLTAPEISNGHVFCTLALTVTKKNMEILKNTNKQTIPQKVGLKGGPTRV